MHNGVCESEEIPECKSEGVTCSTTSECCQSPNVLECTETGSVTNGSCSGTYKEKKLKWVLIDGVQRDINEEDIIYTIGTFECFGYKPGYGNQGQLQAGCGSEDRRWLDGYKPYMTIPEPPTFDPGVLGQIANKISVDRIGKRCVNATCSYGSSVDWVQKISDVYWEAMYSSVEIDKPCAGLSESSCKSHSTCTWSPGAFVPTGKTCQIPLYRDWFIEKDPERPCNYQESWQPQGAFPSCNKPSSSPSISPRFVGEKSGVTFSSLEGDCRNDAGVSLYRESQTQECGWVAKVR